MPIKTTTATTIATDLFEYLAMNGDMILLNTNNNNNNNNSHDYNSTNLSRHHTRPSVTFSTIIISFYCIIFLLGIVGNSLVVFVVCRNKSMQSVTNVFITNLAVSDILMCLLCVPFTPISFFMANWMFGKFLCHLVPFSLGVCVYVSTLTSLAIAIDRYFVIVHPFKPRMKLGVCLLLIAVVWIVAISISLPLAIYVKFTPASLTGSSASTCVELWPQQMLKRFFELASLVLQYLIPFTVISYSYTKIWIILSKRTRPGKTKEKEQIELKRKKRTNRMLVAMVAIFAGCWMPLNIVHLIMEFKKNFTDSPTFSTVFFVAHTIAMSSTVYNPFLYAWLNDNFHKEFRSVIPCVFKLFDWCRRCRPNHHLEGGEYDDEENRDPSKNNFLMTHRQSSMATGGGHNSHRSSHQNNHHINHPQHLLLAAEPSTCIDYVSCKAQSASSPVYDDTTSSNSKTGKTTTTTTTKFIIPSMPSSPNKEEKNKNESENETLLQVQVDSPNKKNGSTNGNHHHNNNHELLIERV